MIHRRGDHIVSVATAATDYAVGIGEMKEHLRIDGNTEDALIDAYLKAATELLGWRGELGRAICTMTIDEALQWPTKDVYLSILPVASLVSVKYFDSANVQQTATLGEFTLYKSDDWAFVRSENWPSTYDRPDAITIQYIAGTAVEEVPQNIAQAIKMVVAHWYVNREAVTDLKLTEMPMAAQALIGMSRRRWYA